MKPRKILIVMPRQLGDVLLTTFLPQVIHNDDPQAEIYWYAHPMARQILECNPELQGVIYHPKPVAPLKAIGLSEYLKSIFKNIAAEWQILRAVRRHRFDILIDAMNNPRTALLSLLSGARERISFKTRFIRNLAFTHLLERKTFAGRYIAASKLEFLRPLGFKIPTQPENLLPALTQTEDDKKIARDVFQKAKTGVVVTLSPTHRHPVRQWVHFAELAQKLVNDFSCFIIWLWGPGEEDFVRELDTQLTAKVGDGHSLVPPLLSLAQTAALCGMSDLFIGNSNGLSHVAVAGGARTIELHGPTDPLVWTHSDSSRHVGLGSTCECRGSNTCQFGMPPRCQTQLSVDEVLRAFVDLTRVKRNRS